MLGLRPGLHCTLVFDLHAFDFARRRVSPFTVCHYHLVLPCEMREKIDPSPEALGGKGLDAASGEIKGMQSKDEGAMEAGAEPEQNGSCKVDTSAFLRP